jgi:hypothetical protein
MMGVKNRIVGSGVEKLDNILFNPRNWRIHPLNQQNALNGVLDEVGWVQEVIVNQRTGNLVDGHLRCQLASRKGETEIPVKYVDLSEEEEALVLATIDPIGAMAATDKEKLDELLNSFEADTQSVKDLLDWMKNDGVDYEKEWQGMPEFNQEDLGGIQKIAVNFKTREDVIEFKKLIGQNITDRTRSIWYPEAEKLKLNEEVYRDEP